MLVLTKRFWSKVARLGPDECWLWQAGVNEHGYGRISTTRADGPVLAHRAAYEAKVGPLAEGEVVRHRCDNPRCVNPNHLIAGTMMDNTADMMERKRHHSFRITHCPQGHEYLPGSFYSYGNHRMCKTCAKSRASVQRAKKKATSHV